MASEKRWDPQRRAEEYLAAFGFLDTMNVHFSKRHRWSDALDAAETLRRVEMALGAAPLSRADVEAIYGEVAAQGGGGTSRDFVRAVENCSAVF